MNPEFEALWEALKQELNLTDADLDELIAL